MGRSSVRRYMSKLWALGVLTGLAVILPGASAGVGPSNEIFTSSVSYCAPPGAIRVDRFQVVYFRDNQSIGFDIIAQSVEANVNPILDFSLNAYGLNPINLTFDLCSVASGVLCPLPQYNFSGSGVYQIPLEYAQKIPSLAYTVPDLEAVATVTLTQQNTGQQVACLQATLSNGKTTHLAGVSWATGGIAIAAFASSLLHSFLPHSPSSVGQPAPAGPEWGVVTIVQFFQTVSTSGLLSLNYPNVYQAFSLNFGWAMGLINIAPIEAAINRMRMLTGSNKVGLADVPATAYQIRELSPYNLNVANGGRLTNVVKLDLGDLSSRPLNLVKRQITGGQFGNLPDYQIPVVDGAGEGSIQAGIPTYAQKLRIPYVNAWSTVFIVFLLLCCVLIAILLIALGIMEAVVLVYGKRKGEKWVRAIHREYGYFAVTNTMRIVLISYAALMTFAFYQFTIRDSWLTIFLAAITVAIINIALAVVSFIIIRTACHPEKGIDHIYEAESYSRRWATLYEQYKRRAFYFFVPVIIATLAKSAFIAFVQNHAWVQVIGNLVIEFILLVAFIVVRPFRDRGSNLVNIFIQVARVVSFGILIAFIESVGVKPIPRTVIGIVLLAIQSIVALILFVLTVINLGWGILWARRKAGPRGPSDDQPSPYNGDGRMEMQESGGLYFKPDQHSASAFGEEDLTRFPEAEPRPSDVDSDPSRSFLSNKGAEHSQSSLPTESQDHELAALAVPAAAAREHSRREDQGEDDAMLPPPVSRASTQGTSFYDAHTGRTPGRGSILSGMTRQKSDVSGYFGRARDGDREVREGDHEGLTPAMATALTGLDRRGSDMSGYFGNLRDGDAEVMVGDHEGLTPHPDDRTPRAY